MDGSLVLIVLLVLSFTLATNLFLTLRLVAIRRAEFASMQRYFTVPIGFPVPEFHGRVLADDRWITSKELVGQAIVLVFLSPVCPKCLGKIPELEQMSPYARRLGISFWVIGVGSSRRLSRLLKGTDLIGNLLFLDSPARRMLNPQAAAPFYLFIDDRGVAQASDLIGDDNWRLFADQLREALPGPEGGG